MKEMLHGRSPVSERFMNMSPHNQTRQKGNQRQKQNPIFHLLLVMAGILFLCVSLPWLPPKVAAQGPAENIARQTKNISLVTLEGQTISREVTCEVDFNQKKWRMLFQRPLAASAMTVQIRVHNTTLQTFPLHSAPEDWQSLSLPPELEPQLFAEGVMFVLESQPGVTEYTFLLFSRTLAKLVEFEIHPVYESNEENKDAQGRSPVFRGDLVRVHYRFSRDIPSEANGMIGYRDGEKMPLRPEGEGDFVIRFYGFVNGYCPPRQANSSLSQLSENMRLSINFYLPQSVDTPEGTVQFQPYYNFPEVMGKADIPPKLYIYPEDIRDDDLPPPVPFSPAVQITPGGMPNTWFFSFPNADPEDMLVTTNQGMVMQARRLGELLKYHMEGQIPNGELYFGDVAPHSNLAVGIVKVANPRPFPAVMVSVPQEMKNHYVELGKRVRTIPPILCHSSPAYQVPRIDTMFDPPPSHPMPVVPPPTQLPPNPNQPGIVAQYRFDLLTPEGDHTVSGNEPLGFYVWLPTSIIQDLNQQAPPEWHLYFPHATRLAFFPQGAWYRIFISENTADVGPPAYAGFDPNNFDPGVVYISIGVLITPLQHQQLPRLDWLNPPGSGQQTLAAVVKFKVRLMGQEFYTADWNRPDGNCARPTLSTASPAPPYRSYTPAPYGRAPYFPFAQYVLNGEPTFEEHTLGANVRAQFIWARGHFVDEHGTFEPEWWFILSPRSILYRYAVAIDLVLNGFASIPVLDRDSGKIGHIPLNHTSFGALEWAQSIGYHTSEMHPDDRITSGLGCPDDNIEVSAQPTEVSGTDPVEITIHENGRFFYGVIEGGVEPVVFQSPGTYQVVIPEGSGEVQLWAVFYGSTLNCPPVIKEITVQRGPVRPSKWRISAMSSLPALKEPLPQNGCYWEGPAYEAGIPVLKALSRTYQKLYGHSDIIPLPQMPERKGISIFHEGMSTGVRQRDW